jgi:hypothetical protein
MSAVGTYYEPPDEDGDDDDLDGLVDALAEEDRQREVGELAVAQARDEEEAAPGEARWRYLLMTTDQLYTVTHLRDKAQEMHVPHGSQPGWRKGTRLFGARCTDEQWRRLKLGVAIDYERS